MLATFLVFFFVQAGVTSYLETYVDDTSVIADSQNGLVNLVLWVTNGGGMLVGLVDQKCLPLPYLYQHTAGVLVFGAVAAAAVVAFPNSAFFLWVGVAGFGFFNGPTVAYCFDINNHITVPSEMGMSVASFGLNFGMCIGPYIVSSEWRYLNWPQSLFVFLVLTHTISCLLLLRAKRIADVKGDFYFQAVTTRRSSVASSNDMLDSEEDRLLR